MMMCFKAKARDPYPPHRDENFKMKMIGVIRKDQFKRLVGIDRL